MLRGRWRLVVPSLVIVMVSGCFGSPYGMEYDDYEGMEPSIQEQRERDEWEREREEDFRRSEEMNATFFAEQDEEYQDMKATEFAIYEATCIAVGGQC